MEVVGRGPVLRGIHEVVTGTQLQFHTSVASHSVAIILKPSTAPDGQKKVLTECGLGERFLFLFIFHFILFCLKCTMLEGVETLMATSRITK